MSTPYYPPFDLADPYAADSGMRRDIEYLKRRPTSIEFPYEVKVFSDDPVSGIVVAGDGKFIWQVSKDYDATVLVFCEAYVTTVSSSGLPTVQLRNVTRALDMLSTRITIDVGEKNSKAAATPVVIDPGSTAGVLRAQVAWGDHISIDVDVAGTGSVGLGVIMYFR